MRDAIKGDRTPPGAPCAETGTGMTLKKCLFSNIRLECGLRLAPLRMQERNFFVLRFRGGAVCV